MDVNDTKTERMEVKTLKELDNLKHVHRKESYANRVSRLWKYCKKNKREFEKWLKEEVKNERK